MKSNSGFAEHKAPERREERGTRGALKEGMA